MRAGQLVQSLFPRSAGELTFAGVRASSLAEQFGTPVFAYDETVLLRQWRSLRDAFPERFEIVYSVKANPNLNIIAFFVSQGAGAEIASTGELVQAQQAGCPASRMLFAGPGKTESELRTAIRSGIGEIHAESLRELKIIARLAKESDHMVRIALRVNPQADAQGGAMRMGGKSAPFGIDEESLDEAVEFVVSEPRIRFQGIHIFSGTQILDHQVLLSQYRKGLQVGRRVAERLGRPLATIDFGGGLGIPYFDNEQELSLEALRSELCGLCAEADADERLAGTRFLIEPGRFLVGPSGVYLTKVLDVKSSRGKQFIITDGGMHHHLAASGNLGQTIKRNFPIVVANKCNSSPTATYDVVGPLCTPLDTIGRSVSLPAVEPDDLIAVLQSGAYARSASPLGFLSHPSPAEVLVEQSGARLIRRRGDVTDYVQDVEFQLARETMGASV